METSHTLAMRDGVALHYRLARAPGSQRRVIVLLHGLASNLTRWSEFVELTTLGETFDLLRVDLRGHGESFTRGRIGMRIWCEDLLTLLDHEKYERVIVIGHSLGAQIAAHLACRAPERVEALVLLDPVFRVALAPKWKLIARLAPLAWLLVWMIRLLNKLGLRRRHIPNRDLRRLDEKTRATMLSQGKQAEMIARYSSPWPDLEHFPTANYIAEYIELLRPLPDLHNLDMPVLVLLSKGITFTDLNELRAAVRAIPNAETQMIQAYHWPLTENPTGVRTAIENWIARIG